MDNSSVSRFSDIYIYKTKAYDVNPNLVWWYVRYAWHYIKVHP